jgi:DNA-binding MarR family transcriptional regulator
VSRSGSRQPHKPASPAAAAPASPLTDRLGYLLKHAQLALGDLTGPALAPFEITGRELAVLVVLAAHEPLSQQQAAGHLGVDRTTMVDIIDVLERRDLVARHPDPADRRRNIVQLTAHGQYVLREGGEATLAAERQFLAPLDAAEATQFTAMLQRLLPPPTGSP